MEHKIISGATIEEFQDNLDAAYALGFRIVGEMVVLANLEETDFYILTVRNL